MPKNCAVMIHYNMGGKLRPQQPHRVINTLTSSQRAVLDTTCTNKLYQNLICPVTAVLIATTPPVYAQVSNVHCCGIDQYLQLVTMPRLLHYTTRQVNGFTGLLEF